MAIILGPLPCATCRQPVIVDRIGSSVRVMQRGRNVPRRHHCEPKRREATGVLILKDGRRITDPSRRLCGAWMPLAREWCARRHGHADTPRYSTHRTRYSMDCAARDRRKWRVAATVAA